MPLFILNKTHHKYFPRDQLILYIHWHFTFWTLNEITTNIQPHNIPAIELYSVQCIVHSEVMTMEPILFLQWLLSRLTRTIHHPHNNKKRKKKNETPTTLLLWSHGPVENDDCGTEWFLIVYINTKYVNLASFYIFTGCVVLYITYIYICCNIHGKIVESIIFTILLHSILHCILNMYIGDWFFVCNPHSK